MKLGTIFLIFLILVSVVYSLDIIDTNKMGPSQKELQAMTSDQIAGHFDEIGDLTKIAETGEEASKKAIEAIKKKYGIEVTGLGEGAIIRKGILSATYGEKGRVTLTDDYYKNGKIEITHRGDIMFLPDSPILQSPPKTDRLNIYNTNVNKLNINLPNKRNIAIGQGTELLFDEGQLYFFSGEINGVDFNQRYWNPIPIYLETNVPTSIKEYILLDTENEPPRTKVRGILN